jgi:hypothetical protein
MNSTASTAATGQQPDQINFNLLKQHYQKQLFKFFEDRLGTKTLYIDKSLIKVLSFVMGTLPENLAIKQKFLLDSTNVYQPSNPTVVFIVRPTIETMDAIVNQRNNWKKPEDKDVHILFVPRRTIECDERLLENDLFQEDKIS